jgi:hypothetical protein
MGKDKEKKELKEKEEKLEKKEKELEKKEEELKEDKKKKEEELKKLKEKAGKKSKEEEKKKEEKKKQEEKVNRKLIENVIHNLQRKIPLEDIKTFARENNYSDDDINKAIVTAKKEIENNPKAYTPKNNKKKLIVFAVVIGILIVLLYFSLTGELDSFIQGNASLEDIPSYIMGRLSFCQEIWNCGEWSACGDGIQTKICVDKANCGTVYSRPPIEQVC